MTVSMKNDFARNPASENKPTVTPYTKNATMTTMKSTARSAVPIDTLVYFYFISFKNALYPRYTSYTSDLLVTSYGACIDRTATPLSITLIALFAMT